MNSCFWRKKDFISEFTRRRSPQAKRRGFTVIEMLLVIGIIGILGLVSFPGIFQVLSQGYFTNTVERMVRTLRTAQSYSLSGKADSSWGVHYEEGKLVLFKGTDYAARDPSFDAVTAVPVAVVVTGWSDLYFDRLRGNPSAPLSVMVEVYGRAGTISVNSQGGINRP